LVLRQIIEERQASLRLLLGRRICRLICVSQPDPGRRGRNQVLIALQAQIVSFAPDFI
jgi:hypothetical protein